MSNLYLEYVQGLAELNAQYLTPDQMPTSEVFNALAWGLVEEMEEYLHADETQVLKESGDVLAYAALLLLCVATVEETADLLESAHKTNGMFSSLDFYSNLKRVNRENDWFNWTNVVRAWSFVYNHAHAVHSLTFAYISQTNLTKLRDRANRGLLFKGSGDAR